ncbi:MAG: DUF4349 domain-containing protein [Leptospiraceae bacterium]|nr:DUF4349 domain-containing protein [Leptospiraceae bacterium]
MDQKLFKNKFKTFFVYFIISFFALFFLRLLWGYFQYPNESSGDSSNQFNNQQQSLNLENSRKNYASEKKSYKEQSQTLSSNTKFDQKYEKVGSLSSGTNEFDKEEKNLRDIIKNFKALIQSESNTGLEGKRQLHLGIGVNPDKFDEMILEIKKIGKLESIQIHKTDKTNEYRNLNAQRESLEKTRAALISFKGKGGKIDELINLENKILEVEESIQKLGVKLGEFDQENEFCTILFSLSETGKANKSWFKGFLHRIKVAFEWTVKYYLLISVLFVIAAIGILIFILILEKLKIFNSLISQFSNDKSNE